MNYADTKVEGISKKTLKALEQIALESDYVLEARGGIDVRYNDEEDFPEIGIHYTPDHSLFCRKKQDVFPQFDRAQRAAASIR